MQRCSDKKPTPNIGMMALESITKMLPPGAFVEARTYNILIPNEDGECLVVSPREAAEAWGRAREAARESIRIHERLSTAPAKPNPPAECKTEDPDATPLSWEFDDDPPKGNPFDSSTPRWLADAIKRLHGEE